MPFEDFSSAAETYTVNDKFSLYPKHGPIIINIPIRGIDATEVERIRNRNRRVCVRLFVKYRDSFTDNRYANFGYSVEVMGLSILPKYNDSN